jgi:hypothetical protein
MVSEGQKSGRIAMRVHTSPNVVIAKPARSRVSPRVLEWEVTLGSLRAGFTGTLYACLREP